MSSSPLVEVFILCYNRREFVREAIRSVLDQTYQPLRIIVSDNSTTNEVSDDLRINFPDLEIRRRQPSVSSYDHFNLVLSEARAEYFMIFHDDDILEPSYIASLIGELGHSGAVAGCANARLIDKTEKTNRLVNPTLKKDVLLAGPAELVRHYLNHSSGVNPFPGYIYRRAAIEGLKSDVREAGQYSDVTFLMKVAQRGPILWKAEPLMFYRKHGENMSGGISLLAAKKLTRFASGMKLFSNGAPELREFRYWNHLFYARNRRRQRRSVRWAHLRLIILYFALHPAPLLRKLFRKYLPG